ncbi:MAG: hypothetical protein R2878_06125 [Thermoleophilia bacterium]
MSERDPLKPVYAIFGEDRPKVERTVARLIKRAVEDGCLETERLTAHEHPPEVVAASAQTLSFGGMRLIVVDEADAWRAPDVGPLVAYLDDPNPGTVLAIVSAGGVPQKLHQAIERVGQVLRWGPPAKASVRERRRWLEEHFTQEVARLGGRVAPGVARMVMERVCPDPTDSARTSLSATMLSTEAQKLVVLAGDEPIDRRMVADAVHSNPEARVYELADALVSGTAADVYHHLHDLAGGDAQSAPQVIVMGLMRHFRALAAGQAMGPAPSPDQITEATGIRGFPARKVAEQVQSMPANAGAHSLARLARLEIDLRVSVDAGLGVTPDDGRRYVLERAARDLIAIARGGVESH